MSDECALFDLLEQCGDGEQRKRKAPAVAPTVALEQDSLSGIRVTPSSRRLSRDEVSSLATAFPFRKLSALGQSPSAATWMTIGVLVEKSAGKETVRGDTFCVWKLSDLTRGSSTICLMLFGDAAAVAWKVSSPD